MAMTPFVRSCSLGLALLLVPLYVLADDKPDAPAKPEAKPGAKPEPEAKPEPGKDPNGKEKKERPRASRQDLSKWQVQDNMPVPLWNERAFEAQAYCKLIDIARGVERSTFERGANKQVTFATLMEDPAKYRGEVVHCEGILRKLRRADPPAALRDHVPALYVGWIFDPRNGDLNRNQPWYVVFTQMPPNLDLKDRPEQRVTFDGYFFKRLRFEVQDDWFDAPLVIGRTLSVVRELPSNVAYRNKGAQAAASVLGYGTPLNLVGPLVTGSLNLTWPPVELKPWQEELPKVATKLDWLNRQFTIIDREPVISFKQDPSPSSETVAYYNVMALAHKLPQTAIQKGARSDLTFTHFFEEPEKYRGEVVHIDGTLARVTRYDPSNYEKEAGIKDHYEGWIYDPKNYGANPMCLVFSELPAGVKEGKNNVAISFDGYFFKLLRYKSGERTQKGEVSRLAPLLMGKTITVRKFDTTVMEQGLTTGKSMVMGFLGLLLATMAIALGVAYYYRRGDKVVRTRIATASNVSFTEPTMTPEETAAASEQGPFTFPGSTTSNN
jgi:hypothetical protein